MSQANEAQFEVNEMFISATDELGIITSGNSVFVRVSGYSKEKLIGAPHNIIRHPDIPKSVFKYFWSVIQSGKPICAYVKNRSIDGKPYWVFASVVPAGKGYLSVRIKPTSPFFTVIPALYAKMLEREKQKGIDAALALLGEELSKLGFKSYEDFMHQALAKELQCRDEEISKLGLESISLPRTSHAESRQYISLMHEISQSSSKAFVRVYKKLEEVTALSAISEQVKKVKNSCERLEYLSLNMSVTANKLGKEGPSLATISATFQKSSREISDRLNRFFTSLDQATQAIGDMKFRVGLTRVYIDMLAFHSLEELNSLDFENRRIEAMNEMQQVNQTVQDLFNQMMDDQRAGLQSLKDFRAMTNTVKNIVLSLDLIRMGGKLEGSRTMRTEEAFGPYVAEMLNSIEAIEAPIQEVYQVTEKIISLMEEVRVEMGDVRIHLVEMDLLRYRDYKSIAAAVA